MTGTQLSRRAFLGGLGAAGAVFVVARGTSPAQASVAARASLASRAGIDGPFPRAFVFRQSEVLAQLRSYPDWAAAFAPLAGLMGKLLPEERTDTVTARNIDYFTRYKTDNPSKAAYLHYNGRGRRPAYRTDGWYAGDWLYQQGSTLEGVLLPIATTLVVDDLSPFSLTRDAFGHRSADLVVTGRRADGTPDWSLAEHVVLTAIDAASHTLTVTRGAYGSTPLTLPTGGYVAPHITLGPWSAQDTRLWAYNLTTMAPRGADGLSVVQRIAAEFAADFAAGGPLELIDGVALDVFSIPTSGPRDRLDADGDGVADGAYANGVDSYLAGQIDFTAALADALGTRRAISTDGATQQRPDPASVNGIEFEGYPTLGDVAMRRWSSAQDRLAGWVTRADAPLLAYPLAKTVRDPGDPIDPAQFRLSLAAALLTGSQFSFWDEPGGTSVDGLRTGPWSGRFADTFTVWDELVGGTAQTPGWLGAPTGPVVRLAPGQPDLLGGAGRRFSPTWVAKLRLSGCSAVRVGRPVVLQLAPPGGAGFATTFTVTLPAASDLVVVLDAAAPADDGLPAGLGRAMSVTTTVRKVASAQNYTVFSDWSTVHHYVHDLPAGDVNVRLNFLGSTPVQLRNVLAYAAPDAQYRCFDHGVVFANPSSHPVTFDVADLLPGVSLVRLTATDGQDPQTNDGTPLGDTLTLPPYDALVVRRG